MRSRCAIVLWTLLSLLFAAPATCAGQQEAQSQDKQAQEKQVPDKQTKSSVESKALDDSGLPPEFEIQTSTPAISIADGQSLPQSASPIRWSRFSIMEVDFLGGVDSSTQNGVSRDYNAGAVRTLVTFHAVKPKFGLTFQYRPAVWFSDGHYSADLSKHDSTIGAAIRIAPRWIMTLSGGGAYYPDQGRLGDVNFTADYSSGSVMRNPYLSTGSKILTGSGGVNFEYAISQTSVLTFGTHYDYFRIFDYEWNPDYLTDYQGTRRHAIIGTIGWAKLTSRTTRFSLQYADENRLFTDSNTTTFAHSIQAGVSHEFWPSLYIEGSIGPVFQYGYLPGVDTGYRGKLDISKRLGQWDLVAFGLLRESSFNSITSDALSNRYDASYGHIFRRRAQMNVSYGFSQQSYSKNRGSFSGWIVTGEGSLRLYGGWELFGMYSHTEQENTSLFGPHTVAAGGLRWTWKWTGADRDARSR